MIHFNEPSHDPVYIGLDNQDPAKVVLGTSFTSQTLEVNGTNLHYVSGGSGKAIIFIHGFSQDWYAFKDVMRLLVKEFNVIAVDLRGMGKSGTAQSGFDAETLAKDIYALASFLALEDPYIVGHDMGGMIAYAYARLYPKHTHGVAILDGPLPGTPSTDLMVKLPFLWHFTFHRVPNYLNGSLADVNMGIFARCFSAVLQKTNRR